jgi:hypothetical protein
MVSLQSTPGCSSSEPNNPDGGGGMTPDAPGGGTGLTVFPDTLYTAVTETQKFTVPFIVNRGQTAVTDATVTSSDDTVATVAAKSGDYLITAVAAGSATITAKSGSDTVTVSVTVTTLTDAAVSAGQQVYMSNNCGPCHDGASQPDITSSGLGKHTDAQITGAFTRHQSRGEPDLHSPQLLRQRQRLHQPGGLPAVAGAQADPRPGRLASSALRPSALRPSPPSAVPCHHGSRPE